LERKRVVSRPSRKRKGALEKGKEGKNKERGCIPLFPRSNRERDWKKRKETRKFWRGGGKKRGTKLKLKTEQFFCLGQKNEGKKKKRRRGSDDREKVEKKGVRTCAELSRRPKKKLERRSDWGRPGGGEKREGREGFWHRLSSLNPSDRSGKEEKDTGPPLDGKER